MLRNLVSECTKANHPEVVERAQQIMLSNQPEGVARALEGMALRPDSQPLLQQIEVPALVIHGAEDATIPKTDGETLALGIRGSRLELMPHTGHLSNLEAPAEFNRIVS